MGKLSKSISIFFSFFFSPHLPRQYYLSFPSCPSFTMLRFQVKVTFGVHLRAGAAICGEFLGEFSKVPGDRPPAAQAGRRTCSGGLEAQAWYDCCNRGPNLR